MIPRVVKPFKINDNAYKLELPPGVSLIFNILDLKTYMREEDGLELTITPFREGYDDENITPSDASTAPPTVIQVPIIRARMRLNLEVSSFLSNIFNDYENILLSNDVSILRNIEDDYEVIGEIQGSGEGHQEHLIREGGPI